jgi:hypothetical protein
VLFRSKGFVHDEFKISDFVLIVDAVPIVLVIVSNGLELSIFPE